MLSMKYSINSGISSRRSNSEGTRIVATARRWNRSSRRVPSSDRRSEIARRRRNDPHVHLDPLRAADAQESLVDQHAQDFGLGVLRHVGDFVEKQRAAMRLLERADSMAARRRSSRPKSSASMFSGVIVAELMTTKGAPARGDASWMQRAASSLPTPGEPVINTRELTGATFATICCNWTRRQGTADDTVMRAGAHRARPRPRGAADRLPAPARPPARDGRP